MKKLLFFDFIYNLGGAQRSTLELVSNLEQNGYSTLIVDAHGEEDRFRQETSNLNLQYRVLKKTEDSRIGNERKWLRFFLAIRYFPIYISTIYRLFKVVRVYEPAFVWTNSLKGFVCLLLLKRILGFKLGYFIRGEGAINNKSRTQVRQINNASDIIFVQSNIMKKKAISHGFDERKIFIVSNSIGLHISEEKPNDSFNKVGYLNVLLPASIIQAKGIMEAVEATFKLIYRENIPINLIVAGATIEHNNTSNFVKAVQQKISDYKIERNVQLIGYRDDIIGIMKSSDIVLLPSYLEGMPRVIMEAMLLGKPVISSNVGSVSDLIEHKKNGMLINPRSEEDIVKAIIYLNNVEVREQLAAAARSSSVERFSPQNQVSQFEYVLRTLHV